MPKAAITSPVRSASAPFQNPQVLRRNQACHQCRRRKLPRCPMPDDAKRPACSTCRRSHSYAVAHASPGTDLLPRPECTFDERASRALPPENQEPKNKFERLETRITELEALLREKDQELSNTQSRPSSAEGFSHSALFSGFNDNFSFHDGSQISLDPFPSSTLDDLAGIASLMNSSSIQPSSTHPLGFGNMPTTSTYPKSWGIDHIDPSWPRNLPNLDMLRPLVEAFFSFAPLSSKLFHRPSFMATLALPPTHPKFPLPAILHAMCALGSMYAPDGSASFGLPGSAFVDDFGNAFAELQISAAKEVLESAMRGSPDIFGALQAQIVIAMWFWHNARSACVAFGASLRFSVPCGLNACPPFDPLASSNMARASIIPPATTPYEDEMRRNAFWVAYILERHFASINNFAMFLDDEDIAQLLPIKGESFEAGESVPTSLRQWSHDPKLFSTHVDEMDSFGLHVKSTILMSRVKVFNTRFRIRRHLGDPKYTPQMMVKEYPATPRFMLSVPAFTELDMSITTFLENLPPHMKTPVVNGVIDPALLIAISNAHFATIILHEGHAMIGVDACISACKILAASRAILDIMYNAYSTGHNLALLGVFPMVCWFAAGRVLTRFLRAALDAKSEKYIQMLQTEIDFISGALQRSVICGIGDTVPHAHHYGKMLDDYLAQACGKTQPQPSRRATPPSSIQMDTQEISDEDLRMVSMNALTADLGSGLVGV
ncbi:uncharacterized protein BXZ73DRAFT_39528 [Epithele typhae]|uniref:uncharacterized protein n=1 Tax=Epithele typhae TaxID=378194 RepID=UPI002007ADB5|nr:uncharacterized protein BXZ73DRAFT_39528 [Epithele typhae]KAH9944126.1 hypothetical protein BXZ73DRAFT_39528 [Epithele typhae]